MRYITLSISILLFLFLWEHIAYVNEITFRPTLPLVKLVCVFETLFYYIGILFGRIGSLITYLHFDKFFNTFVHICCVIKDLIMTIRYVKEGIMYVSELFDNVKQVYSTSMFLLFLVGIMTGGSIFVIIDKINNNKISKESVSDFFGRCKSKIGLKEKTN